MIFWLDHRIYGNGRGLGSPYFDQRFYWLSGRIYTWIGGFGAQLQSFEWRHPKPGETRKICGRDFRPFSSSRDYLWLWRDSFFAIPTPVSRVRVSWACHLPDNLDAKNTALREMQKILGDHYY